MPNPLDNVYLRARRAFLPFPAVVGVGHGPKIRAGKVVAPLAIIVLVERKRPVAEVSSAELIPPYFEGWPTDVRVPKLVPDAPRQGGDTRGPQQDFCLTDYQWIDWPKIHRRWAEKRHLEVPGSPSPTRGGGR